MIWFYDERAEAEDAEATAIDGECPVHNIAGTPRHAEVILAAQQRAAGAYELAGTWLVVPGRAGHVPAQVRLVRCSDRRDDG